MVKKSGKSRSKRTTLHQKYKVLKKVKEHHRKKAKELRKKGGRVKPVKDPGIPNAWPFKEQLVKELEFEKERAEQALAAKKEAAKERRVRGSAWALRRLHLLAPGLLQPTGAQQAAPRRSHWARRSQPPTRSEPPAASGHLCSRYRQAHC